MQITEGQQLDLDLDWFCVDEDGLLGHFASAGFKNVPQSIASSAEDLALVTNYFTKQASQIGSYKIDSNLSAEIPEISMRSERYLRSFAAMAEKGLFSFDIRSYLEPGICYFRVAIPVIELYANDLPDPIRDIVERTPLKGKKLREMTRISYKDTLTM